MSVILLLFRRETLAAFHPRRDHLGGVGRPRQRIIVSTMKTTVLRVYTGPCGWRIEMSEKIYAVPADWAKRAWIDDAKYREMYARSISDPNGFWAEQAKRIGW